MICIIKSHLFLFPSKASSFVLAFCSDDVFLLPLNMMDGTGLDSFKHSLIPRNFRAMCVSLQYWKHKKHTSADLSIHAKKSLISEKEKSRVIGPKLVLSVIWGAGPVELSVKKDVSFRGLNGSSFNSQLTDPLHLPKVKEPLM